jgi:tetratricopeptide (TPR) repeat protein
MLRVTGRILCAIAGIVPLLSAQKSLNISFPDKPWSLQIDADGFHVQTDETKPDGRRYLLASNERTKIELSVTLERIEGTADLNGCDDNFRGRLATFSEWKPADVRQSRDGNMALLEFIFHTVNGVPVEQKNIFACLPKGDVYVDVHLSKASFVASDQAALSSVLKSVRFVEKAAAESPRPQLGSIDYWRQGSKFYVVADYAKAIEQYQKGLDLEKRNRKLDQTTWRVMVDNLGMAYGITGKSDSAEEVFRYGISVDSSYPLFYYNLACVYAERDDMDSAMRYLSTAFKYRQNVIAGEKMPDPRGDDSFQRFMKNEKFRKLIDSF